MDKKSIERITFNFAITISKDKDRRRKSNFKVKHYKNDIINEIENEVWKPVKEFEDIYYVSNKGRVKNIIVNKLMSTFKVCNYLKVSLKAKPYFIHKLVAESFIPNPDNKLHVNHIDTNTLNNNVENLKWVTIKENNNNPITISKQVDRLRSYNINRKIRIVKFKYKDYNNTEIFDSVLDAANSINDASTNISRVCKANAKIKIPRYRCKNYCFMYEKDFIKIDNYYGKV